MSSNGLINTKHVFDTDDDTRVVLGSDHTKDSSDYVNASYIHVCTSMRFSKILEPW